MDKDALAKYRSAKQNSQLQEPFKPNLGLLSNVDKIEFEMLIDIETAIKVGKKKRQKGPFVFFLSWLY